MAPFSFGEYAFAPHNQCCAMRDEVIDAGRLSSERFGVARRCEFS